MLVEAVSGKAASPRQGKELAWTACESRGFTGCPALNQAADRVAVVSLALPRPAPKKAIPDDREWLSFGGRRDWRPYLGTEDVCVEETWRSPLKPGKYRKNIILFSWFQQRPERIHPPRTGRLILINPKKATPYTMRWLCITSNPQSNWLPRKTEPPGRFLHLPC